VTTLFTNTVGPPSTSTPSNAWSVGTCFTVSDGSAPITGLAWYRGATGSTAKPGNLRLYGTDTTTPLREFNGADIVDSGAVGWQITPFATAYTPSAGVHYVAQMTWPGLVPWYYYSRSSLANPDAPYAWDSAGVRRSSEFGSTYPGSQDDTLAWLVSPVWGGSTGGGGGLTSADLQDALADWFDPTDATKPSGTPKLYPDTIIGLNGKIDNDGITWDAKMGPMLAYGGVGTHGISFGVDVVRQQIAALPTPASPGSIVALSGDVAALQSDLDAFEAATTANFLAVQNALASIAPVQFPGTGWSMTDEQDFTLSVAYAQPADLYVVTCDPATIAPAPVAISGVDWYPHLLWHATLNGTFLGERRFGDFANLHVTDGGRRMPGLLVKINQGGDGHIQAWQYAP